MKKRKGILLIEALFVLGIMAILIGMVMVYYSHTEEKYIANETVQEVIVLFNFISDYKSQHGNVNGIDVKFLKASNVLPDKYFSGDSTLLTPSKGTIALTAVPTWGTGEVAVWLNGISKESCMALAQMDIAAFTNVRRVNWEKEYDQSVTASMSPSDAEKRCNENGDNDAVEFNVGY